MKEINVGIIGGGFMGNTHIYGYKTIPLYYKNLPFKINLIGICDVNLKNAENMCNQLNFNYVTDNYMDIINDKNINVVDICTPNNLHSKQVLAAINAGKHVYCDKPLCTCDSEAKEILAAVKNSDLTTQMALQYRCFPATMRAKEIIDERKIGQILSFRACYLHSGSVDRNKPQGWKQQKKYGGGGVLFDLGSHVLDLLHYLLGDFEEVYAKTDIVYKTRPLGDGTLADVDAEDVAYMILKLACGGLGTVEANKVATGANDELRFEIHGENGSLRFNLMQPNYLEYYDNTLPEMPLGGIKGYTAIECVHRYNSPGNAFPGPKFSVGWIRSHVHSLYNFLENVVSNKPSSPSFEDGIYIQRVMERAYESSLSGCLIKL